ncbi:DUF5994 family protein [Nocardia transvalensis]|uniref:DUF5994 family protein n=1 Tax=Nocardia transvalensis TaxID=37333 RepID=UPI0018963914|nr:DUF5994 family protein [Nocardia transvalensis]MBF6334108.1 hypothetical protein [Nocardia transvalensis]
MTTQSTLPDTGRDPPAAFGARLRLRADTPTPGHIDGAWWPHSDNLAAGLPDLLALLRLRLGPIHRVTYHLTEWSLAPRRFADAGRRVRLDGYRLKPARTLDVLGVSGDRIALLVVPPNTTPDVADATMNATTHSANPSTVDELLIITARAHRDHTESTAAEHTWDSEGGAAFS